VKPSGRDTVLRVRTATPEPLLRFGRQAYSRMSTATASLRLEPGFIMIGAQRCGTTSLFRALSVHPQVVPPTFRKGVNYFDLNYYRGASWYRGHFPVAEVARRRTARRGAAKNGAAKNGAASHGAASHVGPVAFEASGYYMYHPWALERLAADLPATKLVVMLRDPVERAYSAYKHEYARGYEQESFERALALEDERLEGEIAKMRADPSYESHSHRHHSYRHRGYYADQLERAFGFFPAGQVHVIDSETYFGQPAQEYQRLLAFLGLRPFEPAFEAVNGRPGPPLPAAARQLLEDSFAAQDERLGKLLGHPPSWAH
jgi:hypothetical protein